MTSTLWTWERCGAQILSLKNRLGFSDELCFLKYCIHDDGTVFDTVKKTHLSSPEGVYWLLTHYAQARECSLTNELIPYDKLPGGYAFFGAFRQLAINPLIKVFGDRLEDFEKSCVYFQGAKQSYGDSSFQLPSLPLIPITVVLWEKDEEFPPRCSLFYDESASNYLPTEDLAHLGELLSHRLIEVQGIV